MWSVFFVFLSYLDRNFVKGELLRYSLDGEKYGKEMFLMLNSTFCAKMSVIGENYLYQVSDGVEEVSSVRNLAGKLVDCAVTVNQMQVKSFMHVCRLGLKDQIMTKLENFETKFAQMAEAKSNCLEFQRRLERKMISEKIATQPLQEEKDERQIFDSDEDKVLRRSKRGFTYPGTLWCGAGNMADDESQLGEFAETDSCCRVHDHCPHVIHAFSSKYGYTNFKWHSICHCDCDNALKDCLRKVNDTSSRVVGQAFFNVMEVPCFEFVYEEQCVERHWYGVCKKYEKLPIAVARQSIPYDFGGIDVIDVLTVAPPKKSNKAGEEPEQREGPTESTVSGSQTTGPEEPSLSNVVTAAEDFIKVLATVSTSQSSTTESAKGEAQTSEKKKKKNSGKKEKNKKKKGKGRGRKRKHRVDSGSKTDESSAGTPAGRRPEEVIDKSNFVDDSNKIDPINRNINEFIDDVLDLGGREEPSNDVMKDQPMIDEENSSIAATSPVKKEPQQKETQTQTESKGTALLSVTTSTNTTIAQQKKQRKGKGRKRPSYTFPTSPSLQATTLNAIDKEVSVKTTDAPIIHSSTPMVTTEQPVQQRLGPVTSTAPIVAPLKGKRHRSKEREERNKRRRITSIPPIEETAPQNSIEDDFKVIARIDSPTTTTVPAAQTHRPHIDRDQSLSTTSASSATSTTSTTTTTASSTASTASSTTSTASSTTTATFAATITTSSTTTTATSTLSALQNKRQRSKEREGRKRRKKVALPGSAGAMSLQGASEEPVPELSTTASPSVPAVRLTPMDRPAWKRGLHTAHTEGERGRLVAPAGTAIHTAGRHGPREAKQRKRRKENMPAVCGSCATLHNDNETDLRPTASVRLAPRTTSSKVAELEELEPRMPVGRTEQVIYTVLPSTPSVSPIRTILQKAHEQLGRKKRRKARLSDKQP